MGHMMFSLMTFHPGPPLSATPSSEEVWFSDMPISALEKH